MRHLLLLLLLLWCTGQATAQRLPAEAGVISDNDLYVSTVSDKYYTAGFEFFYRYLDKDQSGPSLKKITDFRLGQYIFNPRTRKAEDINRIDRPFAGYLFAEAGRHLYYQDETVVKYTAQLGIVGPASFAEQSQEAIFFTHVRCFRRKGA
jgi:lipid A 3-O-deacylase